MMLDETRYQTVADLMLSVILALGVLIYMRSVSLWQRVVVLPVSFILASLVATFYLKDYSGDWQPYFVSTTFYMLTTLEVVALVPLLIAGLLELRRNASHLWQLHGNHR